MNHKWENNICLKCGIKRKRKTRKLLMAITNYPPYNHYLYKTLFEYDLRNGALTFDRPQCIES